MISLSNSLISGVEKLYKIDSDFTWGRICYLDSISYSIEQDELLRNESIVVLGLRYNANGSIYKLYIQFSNVTNMSIKNVGGMYNQLLGFEIMDKSKDGWEESQRFYINDYENGIISFSCARIEIVSIDKSSI